MFTEVTRGGEGGHECVNQFVGRRYIRRSLVLGVSCPASYSNGKIVIAFPFSLSLSVTSYLSFLFWVKKIVDSDS